MRPALAGVLTASTLGAAVAFAGGADASHPPDGDRIGRALRDALVAHSPEVNRCFERALAERLDVSGRVEIELTVAGRGAAGAARVFSRSPETSDTLVGCLASTTAAWSIPGLEGQSVVFPFAFEPQNAQFSVKAADAPEHGPPAPKGKTGGKTGDLLPFSVKVLVDESTMRARQASMSLLTVAPANRIAMHKHPGAEILYVVKGHARVLGPPGTAPQKLDEGFAVFLAPGMPHVIENMGRQTPAVLLDVFVPPGPERVFRDPQDAAGRAAFEVIRDAKGVRAPAGPPAPVTVVEAGKVTALPILGGKGRVKILLDEAATGSQAAALDVMELDPGAVVPRHTHAGAAEMLYVVGGTGELTVGSEPVPFGPDTALHVPEDQPHEAKVTGGDKLVLIQIYAPAGPEQRFKTPAPAAQKVVKKNAGDNRAGDHPAFDKPIPDHKPDVNK